MRPGHLGDFEGAELASLIHAYRERIHIARQEVPATQVPRLRLGLYQVIVPDGKGRDSSGFQRRMTGYREAGHQGMYDELEFLCPVLFHRFGIADDDTATVQQWISRSTRQALEGSLELTRSDGGRIPMVPTIGFWVFNGGSSSNRDATLPDAVDLQLEAVQRSIGIAAILFWSGWQTTQEMETAHRTGRGDQPRSRSWSRSARCRGPVALDQLARSDRLRLAATQDPRFDDLLALVAQHLAQLPRHPLAVERPARAGEGHGERPMLNDVFDVIADVSLFYELTDVLVHDVTSFDFETEAWGVELHVVCELLSCHDEVASVQVIDALPDTIASAHVPPEPSTSEP